MEIHLTLEIGMTIVATLFTLLRNTFHEKWPETLANHTQFKYHHTQRRAEIHDNSHRFSSNITYIPNRAPLLISP